MAGRNGGPRPGSGRPKGKPNRTTIGHLMRMKNIDEPDAVDLMWNSAKWWALRFQRLDAVEGRKRNEQAVERALDRMHFYAKDVAPYFRPRLSAVKILDKVNPDKEPVEIMLIADGHAKRIVDGEVVEEFDLPDRTNGGGH